MFIAGAILANSCGSFEYLDQMWTVRQAAIVLALNRFGNLGNQQLNQVMSCLIFDNNMELIKEEGSSLPVQSNLSLFDDRLVRFLNSQQPEVIRPAKGLPHWLNITNHEVSELWQSATVGLLSRGHIRRFYTPIAAIVEIRLVCHLLR